MTDPTRKSSAAIRGLFITGTDTGVGKTVFTAALAARLRAEGRDVVALKPFASGAVTIDGRRLSADTLFIEEAARSGEAPDELTPELFDAPLAPSVTPLAVRRAPSEIQPEAEGSNPFSYPRLVQPVFDRHCVACHAKEPKAFDMSAGNVADNGGKFYPSYNNLRNFSFFYNDAAFTTPMTIPGKFGAKESRLYKLLQEGHYDVKMSKEEMHRITLWLDSNSDFFGSYENTKEQAQGGIVLPTLE